MCRVLRDAAGVSAVTTPLAARFERLGFVVVGKAAVSELSAGVTTEPPGFVPTRNPHAPDRTVGGSSGGSAAGLVPLAHGADGTGSLQGRRAAAAAAQAADRIRYPPGGTGSTCPSPRSCANHPGRSAPPRRR